MSVRPESRVNPGVLFLTVLVVAGWPGGVARLQTPPPGAPAQQPQFRAGADVVPVYATVRDKDRGFVLDLTQDDFELYDNGRKQPITQFTLATQPLSAVVLIDGSGSMIQEFNRAIEGARNFVLRMLPEDRAKIGSFADRVVLGPRFTSDKDALLAYLDDQFNLRVGGETHLWEALVESSLALANESGKRVVVVMSDGYNFVLPPGYVPPPAGIQRRLSSSRRARTRLAPDRRRPPSGRAPRADQSAGARHAAGKPTQAGTRQRPAAASSHRRRRRASRFSIRPRTA